MLGIAFRPNGVRKRKLDLAFDCGLKIKMPRFEISYFPNLARDIFLIRIIIIMLNQCVLLGFSTGLLFHPLGRCLC